MTWAAKLDELLVLRLFPKGGNVSSQEVKRRRAANRRTRTSRKRNRRSR